MQVPLDFWHVSLWLAVSSIILLTTAQLAAAYDGKATLTISQRKLKTAAVIMGMLFLATVAVQIYSIITSS